MRDPNRIPVILDEIRKVWEKYPDLRLGQLISNPYPDPFFVEDERLVETLKEYYKTNEGDNQ